MRKKLFEIPWATSYVEVGIMLVEWLQSRHSTTPPTAFEIQQRFGTSRATAYRWARILRDHLERTAA